MALRDQIGALELGDRLSGIGDGALEQTAAEVQPGATRACPSWGGIPCRGTSDDRLRIG